MSSYKPNNFCKDYFRIGSSFFFYYRGKMLYAHPSALTRMGSDLRPNPEGPELQTSPTKLGFRGSVGLDVPCHAAVGSPYPLKTFFPADTHSGT